MEKLSTNLGLKIIQPRVYSDSRGSYRDIFNQDLFNLISVDRFVQSSESISQKGVLRGLHFQSKPYEQGKLVRVVSGEIYDVVVDIRKDSPTFGQWQSFHLSDQNDELLWIPKGYAHGFLSLQDKTRVQYHFSEPYNASAQNGIIWNDPNIGINWNISNPIMSDKDKSLKRLSELNLD